ncbi:tetratricopeptide repeat protein, partial [Porphyromonas loveana]|uniref:tetratricopeptide repeat protein n=1 Tax=Porphyromonas loveana TaxID=1884669 RepID=UPI00359F34B7
LYENQQNFDKAEEWLMKGLAIDPNNASANYDLGRVYYNRAADLKGADQVNAETEAKATEYLKKALPLLEKAYSVNPDESWYVLRNVYYNLKMNDKYKEMTDRHERK